MPSPSEIVRLTRAYQASLEQLGDTVGSELADLFRRLDSWDEADVTRFADLLADVARPAKNSTVRSASAHLSQITALAVTGMPASRVVVVPPDPRAPFTAMWKQLKDGVPFVDAVEHGATVAHTVGKTWTWDTARATTGPWQQSLPPRYRNAVGYRRVLTGSSCEWCALIATQRYQSAESADFGHDNCDCGVAPIIGDRDPGRFINDDLYNALNDADPRISERIDDNRRQTKQTAAAENAVRRRDEALAEAATEADSDRRVRLERRAREWDTRAKKARARAAAAAVEPARFPRPTGSTGYFYADGTPAPRPIPQ